jgi:hypothetical protein
MGFWVLVVTFSGTAVADLKSTVFSVSKQKMLLLVLFINFSYFNLM